MDLPLVVILGAPNVGKSTLFNRLLGRRRAIVSDEPGVTRDRQYADVRSAEASFRLVDTGGIDPGGDAPLARAIEAQAEAALEEADLVLLVVDARAGATAVDAELAQRLRRRGASTILVANKIDSDRAEPPTVELYELGLGAPLPVSAEHGRGIEPLREAIASRLGPGPSDEAEASGERDPALRIALVGRPNVGKSSLVNRLLGEERVLVSEIPGTTRDAIDTRLVLAGKTYVLIDTAGIRRPGKLGRGAERFSVQRAKENIERCDVAVLVLDGSEPLAAQDAHIAGHILAAARPMVVAINKWDIVEERERAAKQWTAEVARRLRFAKEVPLVLVSARSGQRVSRILDLARAASDTAGIQVPTPELNRWLQRQAGGNPEAPPPRGGLRLFYAVQTGVRPPRFLVFCNDPARVHFSRERELANGLREQFGFGGAPIRLSFRARRESSLR